MPRTRITAIGAKTTTQPLGSLWEIRFNVAPSPRPTDDRPNPVQVRVNRPDDTVITLAAEEGEDGYVAVCVLDLEGEHAATVVVEAADGSVAQSGGFTATVTPAEPDPSEPDPEPADAA